MKEKVWTMELVLMSEMVIETLQHSMTSTNFILHCHFELSISGCVLQMWRMGGGDDDDTPLNLTSKIFVCLIVRCILRFGNYGLLIKAPRFSWPVSQVYFWISPFRCIMRSYSISVYTAVAVHFTLAAFDHIPPQINIFSDLQVTMSQLHHTTHLNVQTWVQSQINVYTIESDIWWVFRFLLPNI